MKTVSIALASAALLAAIPASAATNLVQNGGFQSTTTTSANGNFQLTANGSYGAVDNWSTSGGYNLLYNASNATSATGNAAGAYAGTKKEYLNTAPAAVAGNKFIALDGDTAFNTAITQTIGSGLVNGQMYTLAFDWATSSIASRQGALSAGITAMFNGQTFSTGEVAIPSSIWSKASYTFTYNASASNVLSFLSTGTPSGQPPVALLDNVSLTAAVPEPATWAMMLLGFGMVGAATRYRRRSTSAAIA